MNNLRRNANEIKIMEITRIANMEFNGNELKKICKSGLSKNEVLSFSKFYDLKHLQNYSNNLIIKSFLNYRKNISTIIELEEWLYDQCICDNEHTYNMRSLNRLAEIIETERDKELFIDICEAQPTKNHYLLHNFSDYLRAKNEPVFKNIDELEKRMFGKNHDEVMNWRANCLH